MERGCRGVCACVFLAWIPALINLLKLCLLCGVCVDQVQRWIGNGSYATLFCLQVLKRRCGAQQATGEVAELWCLVRDAASYSQIDEWLAQQRAPRKREWVEVSLATPTGSKL